MKPFLVPPNPQLTQQWRDNGRGIFRSLLRALFFSTDTVTTSISAAAAAVSSSSSSYSFSSTPPIDSLRFRILRAGNPSSSVVSVLEEWLDQGNRVNHSDLQLIIKLLRKYRRYTHAFQVSLSLFQSETLLLGVIQLICATASSHTQNLFCVPFEVLFVLRVITICKVMPPSGFCNIIKISQ
uniref:Pentatricopeptide repeat-containing protein At2g20710-like n=1 Tax=Rhizophora mucronata TaxID=61149 RepID=A0A2P2JEC0_RHIMU